MTCVTRRMLSLRVTLVALLLSACTASVDDMDEVAAISTALTDPVPQKAGSHTLAFQVPGGPQRAYILYLPSGYDPARRLGYPVVMMFHGLFGSAQGLAATLAAAGTQDLADDQGKIFVFMHGDIGTAVNTSGYWSIVDGGRDDVTYTTELLDHLTQELNVNDSRIFAAGHSLGGRFVHELGSKVPHRFRAIADISGFYATQTDEPDPIYVPNGLPVMFVHGDIDTIVPPDGGVGTLLPFVNFQPTEYGFDAWYANNGCTEPVLTAVTQFWELQQTYCLQGDTEVRIRSVRIDGHGHSWPSLAGDNFDASVEMLEFFDSH